MTKFQRSAMQSALQWFEHLESLPHLRGSEDCHEDMIAELRAALAERGVEQEPVAWQYVWPDGRVYTADSKQRMDLYREGAEERIPPESCGRVRALYTQPPRREWRGLTDEERGRIIHANFGVGVWQMAQGIEAALKEKNHE